MVKDEKKLRKLLWLNHGCSLDTLYGDDGEMQCNKCLIDFKRDPVDQIETLLFKAKTWTAKSDEAQAIGRTLRDMGKM